MAGHGREIMFYTYVAKSLKDGKRYIGQTGDLEKRIEAHNSGLTKSTRARLPLEIEFYLEFPTRKEAIKYERYLKSLKGGNQFEKELPKMKKYNNY